MLASDWSWNTTWYLKDGLKNTVLVWKKKMWAWFLGSSYFLAFLWAWGAWERSEENAGGIPLKQPKQNDMISIIQRIKDSINFDFITWTRQNQDCKAI